MAAPSKRGSTGPVSGLSTTSPAGTQVGDLVIVITGERAGAGIPTHTLQSPFTEIRTHSHNDGSTDARLSCAAIVATVAGAQSYQAYTTSGSGTVYTGCLVLSVGTYRGLASLPANNSVTATGTGAPDPPSLTSLTGDFTFLNIAFWHLSSAGTGTVAPGANYTEEWETTASADLELALALRDRTGLSAASEDPPAWTDGVTPNGTCSMTIAVQGMTPLTRTAALDGSTTLDILAEKYAPAIQRSAALDGSTTLDIQAQRVAVFTRAAAIDGATTVDVVAARVRTRAAAIDGATTLDVDAPERTLKRASAIDGATSVDIVAARAVVRSVVLDAAATVDIAATRALLRAAAIDGASSVDVAAARVLLRSIALDAATSIDMLAARLLMRSSAIDGATSVDIAAARALVRAVSFVAETSVDVLGVRVVRRTSAIDGVTTLEIDGEAFGNFQTHQRSAALDGSTTIDIAAVRALVRAAAIDALTAVDIVGLVPPRTLQRAAALDAETTLAIVAQRIAMAVSATVTDNQPVIACTVAMRYRYRCTVTRSS